jgi:hypothetical protein
MTKTMQQRQHQLPQSTLGPVSRTQTGIRSRCQTPAAAPRPPTTPRHQLRTRGGWAALCL